MRNVIVFLVLLLIHLSARLLYRFQSIWIGDVPKDPWHPYRLVAILNHTSLYEALFAGIVPLRFLWRMAQHCTVPIADVTIKRPIVGWLWRMIAANPVSISRERDDTWQQVLSSVDDPEAMIIILPEGRMKRADGFDKHGRPMRVRGGIADLLLGIPDGNFLLAYSQGLHHIQVPGQTMPKLFQPVRMRFESLDIATYRQLHLQDLEANDVETFRQRLIADLTRRRDQYCTSDTGGLDRPQEWNKPS